MPLIALLFILSGVLLRFLPHEPNFAPVAAIALFSGFYLPKKFALLVPLAIIIISDLFIGLHNTILFTWGSFVLIGLLGIKFRKEKNITKIIFGSLAGSVLFFIITNFGVFIMNDWYPKTITGFINCYLMALPFFRNTLLGDLFYVFILFGGYEFMTVVLHRYKLNYKYTFLKE